MTLETLQTRHHQLLKLIEAAEAEKAPEEFVIKLKAEAINIKLKIEEEHPVKWERRIAD
jgi:hypothetical protein|tara:strand:+ start:1765 stop:1941 length:177 start_codon:yes stop_codon:yes gene_type:complete